MARLQRLGRSLLAISTSDKIATGGQNFLDGLLSVIRSVSRPGTGLIIVLLSGFTHADVTAPPLSDGTYHSSEQHTYSSAELGLSLSAPALPDPASVLMQKTLASDTDHENTSWANDTAWITAIGTLLYHDQDNDGYHSGLSLTVDADTSMGSMDVYLSIDMQSYYGRRERLHTSRNFPLYGRALADEYQIDIELLQDYPADEYDLTIELHDAYDHRVLDRVGASDFSNLSTLPLESEDLDYVYNPRPAQPLYLPVNDGIRVDEYAGNIGLLTSLSLALCLWARRRRRSQR